VASTWLAENYGFSRKKAVTLCGLVCWVLSFGTIASFSHSQYFSIGGVSFFDAIDYLTSGIMLPLGGLLIAIFTGWLLPKKYIQDKLGWPVDHFSFKCWRWVERYFAPTAILLILLTSLGII
jgi:SNF family Na+-dependent transporter